jgi:hypothetical protein
MKNHKPTPLETLCDDVLIDQLRPTIKTYVDKLLDRGASGAAVLRCIILMTKKFAGGSESSAVVLGVEAYLVRQGVIDNSACESVRAETSGKSCWK